MPRRSPGSALWVSPRSGPVSAEGMAALERVGPGELFLEVARLEWEGGEPRLRADWPASTVSDRRPVTLVVVTAEPPPGVEAGPAATAVTVQVDQLVLDAQGRGLLPVGIHVHPARAFERSAETGRFLGALARSLGERLPLSLTLEPARLDPAVAEPTAQLTAGVGAVVSFLYGQRTEEPEDPAAWSLDVVLSGVRSLEELAAKVGFDHLLGVITLGRLERKGGGGDGPRVTTEASLRGLLARPELELGFGLALEETDRRLWEFDVRAPLRLGPWRLAAGEQLRVSQVGSEQIRELRHRLGEVELEHHLGEVYFRPPRAGEGLSLGIVQLAGALDPQPSRPRIEARLREERRGGRVLVVVEIENVGDRGTDIARVEANFVDLETNRGRLMEARSLGGFQRYSLIDSSTGERSVTGADTLRLFVPYLAPGERIRSGELVASAAASGQMGITGSFRLPDGTPIPVVDVTGRGERAPEEGGSR